MTTNKAKPTTDDDEPTPPDDEVAEAIKVLEAHGITVNMRPPGVTPREDVIEWLRANGFDREAESVLRAPR